jgi:hypothetical protein
LPCYFFKVQSFVNKLLLSHLHNIAENYWSPTLLRPQRTVEHGSHLLDKSHLITLHNHHSLHRKCLTSIFPQSLLRDISLDDRDSNIANSNRALNRLKRVCLTISRHKGIRSAYTSLSCRALCASGVQKRMPSQIIRQLKQWHSWEFSTCDEEPGENSRYEAMDWMAGVRFPAGVRFLGHFPFFNKRRLMGSPCCLCMYFS